MTEQRNYRRIPFQTEATISIDNVPFRCELVDLALQGALFKSTTPLPLAIGAQCPISITLSESALTLEFTGELMHQRGSFYGFIFLAENLSTMAHLRRMLELNLGDGDEIDREFQHWLKRS